MFWPYICTSGFACQKVKKVFKNRALIDTRASIKACLEEFTDAFQWEVSLKDNLTVNMIIEVKDPKKPCASDNWSEYCSASSWNPAIIGIKYIVFYAKTRATQKKLKWSLSNLKSWAKKHLSVAFQHWAVCIITMFGLDSFSQAGVVSNFGRNWLSKMSKNSDQFEVTILGEVCTVLHWKICPALRCTKTPVKNSV